MAESSVAVTEGSGKSLHTYQRNISGNKEDQFVIPGEYPYATYSITSGSAVSVATSSDHVLQIMAGATNNVRLRRILVEQSANATAAADLTLILLRLSSAGTGGTSVTPAKYDTADSAATATAMTLPSSKGTETTELFRRRFIAAQSWSTATGSITPGWEWISLPGTKPIIIPAGTANGVALKVNAGRASASVTFMVEFVETAY